MDLGRVGLWLRGLWPVPITAALVLSVACGGPVAQRRAPGTPSPPAQASPAEPAAASTPQPVGATPVPGGQKLDAAPLHTAGGKLVDSAGNEVRITGINWFGLETGTFAPHGLWARNLGDMLDQIASLGFNTIRLPYSNQLFDASSKPNGIDFQKNPELVGRSGLDIMDILIDEAGQRGLKVILDRHRPTAEAQSPLWYTDHVSEQRWIQDWVMLANHYRGNPAVIGADLHNEPHGPATWGDGNPTTDWRLAAQRAGNAVLQANPDWLIMVEGIEHQADDWYWWGGNLALAGQAPVELSEPDKLVYSTHDYGPGVSQQKWFQAFDFPYNLQHVWRDHWAYLQLDGTAPVLIGEFGGHSVGQDAEGVWQRSLVGFLQQGGFSYTYWSWNPNSGDTGGILRDDWTTVDTDKMSLLAAYQWPLLGTPQPPSARQAPEPVPAQAAVPTTSPGGGAGALAANGSPAVVGGLPQPAPLAGEPLAIGGPFDPDLSHARLGLGGPNDPDAAHRQARERDEQRYVEQFGKPWEYAVYITR